MAVGTGAAIIGGALIGGAATMIGSSQAANAQRDAAQTSSDTQRYMFNRQRADTAPWRDAGVDALKRIDAGMGDFSRDFNMTDFQADPGYQFRMDEANKAIERSAAARGGLNSGATMKALTRYNQDYASNEFQRSRDNFNADRDRRFNRLASLAGIGQTAQGQLNQVGMNAANQIGSNQLAAGNATAAQHMANANAISGGIGSGMNTWMQYQAMNQAPQYTHQTNTPTGTWNYNG